MSHLDTARAWGRRLLPGAVVVAFLLGLALGSGDDATAPGDGAAAADHAGHADESTIWTCSMHPQIQMEQPGKCPICAMDLIPLVKGAADQGPRELRLSESAVALAEIVTVPAVRRAVETRIRMVGKVDFDETGLRRIAAWVPGRIERLFVDYTGMPVRRGDHLLQLYSPELFAAQEELIQAKKAVAELAGSDLATVRRAAEMTVEAVREKLRLLGLAAEQVEAIEARGKAEERITIRAPIGGIVVRKDVTEGMYVQTGTRLLTIADLTRVWVRLDAYESDLPWLRYGQEVEFTTDAAPGRMYAGRIAFLDPVLDDRTRTVKVRVNVPNEDGTLKPGMFVRAVVRPRIAEGGRVVAADMTGKWICPMHPEEVEDEPGACDQCEMPLVRAETLGYVGGESGGDLPLVIPASAPLITGERAVVYVRAPGGDRPTFEGRDVVLGPRAGDHVVVVSGLEEGELVVARGAFKLDSALQIEGRPSMMSPPAGEDAPAEVMPAPAAFVDSLEAVYRAYLSIQGALADDEAAKAAEGVTPFLRALDRVETAGLRGQSRDVWDRETAALRKSATALRDVEDGENIEARRTAFASLSETVLAVVERFGHAFEAPLHRIHCPMAFDDRGADWLQDVEEVANPYFGEAMLRCGVVKRTYETRRSEGR